MMPPIDKGLTKKKKGIFAVSKHSISIHPMPHGEVLQVPKASESSMVKLNKKEPQEAFSDEPTALHNPSAEPHLLIHGIE